MRKVFPDLGNAEPSDGGGKQNKRQAGLAILKEAVAARFHKDGAVLVTAAYQEARRAPARRALSMPKAVARSLLMTIISPEPESLHLLRSAGGRSRAFNGTTTGSSRSQDKIWQMPRHRPVVLILIKYSVILCAMMASFLPVPAAAQTTATHGGSTDRIQLAVPVTASITGRCGFKAALNTTVELGNVETGFSHEIPFVLHCNTPMRLAVISQNGGLMAPVKPGPGYTNLLDYSVTLHAVGSGGTSVTASCRASALIAASSTPCSFRGPASATAGLRLPGSSTGEQGSSLRVQAPPISGRTGLAASTDYADVLYLTLSPSS